MAWPRVYIDANILINAFEGQPPVAGQCAAVLSLANRRVEIVSSEITLSEVLVGAMRSGNHALQDRYLALFSRPDLLTAVAADRAVMIDAAHLRSISRMKLPDAIHVATAKRRQCGAIVSLDRDLFVPPPMVHLSPGADTLAAWLNRFDGFPPPQ